MRRSAASMRLRALLLLALGAVVALAAASPASAGQKPYWTTQQAAKRLVKNDIQWDDGEHDIVVYAECTGRGPVYLSANGFRVWGQFVCYVKTDSEDPYYVRLTTKPGNNYRLKFLYYA
jgi:hypothetical protein